MSENLQIGFQLDRRWHALRGEMERDKEPALVLLARVLAEEQVEYAVIGGIAFQVHAEEPRTTLDIDLAVASRAALPRTRLEAAGFRLTGSFAHSENYEAPGAVPVQFTDDPAIAQALSRAITVNLRGESLRVLAVGDLLREKLRAARDPARRKSKRMQDLADATALVETHPGLLTTLSEEERAQLED